MNGVECGNNQYNLNCVENTIVTQISSWEATGWFRNSGTNAERCNDGKNHDGYEDILEIICVVMLGVVEDLLFDCFVFTRPYGACSFGEIYSPSVHCPVQIHGKTRKQRLLSTEQNPSSKRYTALVPEHRWMLMSGRQLLIPSCFGSKTVPIIRRPRGTIQTPP